MKDNVVFFPDQMMDVKDWEWSDFKKVWQAIADSQGEDVAWQTIYSIWQHRAGEGIK